MKILRNCILFSAVILMIMSGMLAKADETKNQKFTNY